MLEEENVTVSSTVFYTEITTSLARDSVSPVLMSEEISIALVIFINFYLSVVSIWYFYKHGRPTLKVTNTLCCTLTVLLLLRSCTLEVRARTGTLPGSFCNVTVTILNILYGLNKSFPYVILWIRQRFLYKNVIQKRTAGIISQVLSWSSLIGIVVFEMVLTSILVAYLDMKPTPTGCVFVNPKKFLSVFDVLSPVIFAASTLLQLTLLGLVLYPLILHILSKKFCHTRMKRTIVRLGLCTSVCILSDLLNLVIKYVVPPKTSSILILICSCYNNTICLVAVLFTFADPLQRFFPAIKTRAQVVGPNPQWSNVWTTITSKRTLSQKSTGNISTQKTSIT